MTSYDLSPLFRSTVGFDHLSQLIDSAFKMDERAAGYAGFFEPEFAELNWSRPAAEVHRQVRAWWVAAARDGVRGPLADLEGRRVRVLRTRLDGSEGGTRIDCADGPIWVLETAAV